MLLLEEELTQALETGRYERENWSTLKSTMDTTALEGVDPGQCNVW